MAKFKEEAKIYQEFVDSSLDKSFIYKVTKLFELLRSSYDIVMQFRKAKLDYEMYQVFSSIYPTDKSLNIPYEMTYKIGGVYMVIMKWMEDGMVEKEEEMAKRLKDIINYSMEV